MTGDGVLFKGIALLLLSGLFWLFMGAWILAPRWLGFMEQLWRLIGQPGWLGRIGYLFGGLFAVLFLSLRLLRSGP